MTHTDCSAFCSIKFLNRLKTLISFSLISLWTKLESDIFLLGFVLNQGGWEIWGHHEWGFRRIWASVLRTFHEPVQKVYLSKRSWWGYDAILLYLQCVFVFHFLYVVFPVSWWLLWSSSILSPRTNLSYVVEIGKLKGFFMV